MFELQRLEQRMFLSVAPASGAAAQLAAPADAVVMALAAPGDQLSHAIRQQLLDHWNGPNASRADLQAKLDANKMGAFDGALLDYMKSRGGNTFFWNTKDVGAIKNFINEKLATATTIANADDIVAHRFPNGNSENYDVQLGSGDIDWTSTTSNRDFIYTLNRQEFWLDLSQAYVLTGQSKYINELTAELSSWSRQMQPPSDPNDWGESEFAWQPLTVATRAASWTWAYQMVLGTSGWMPAANTLFLYKLWQHGDFLRRVERYPLASNRALASAEGLMSIAHLVPEFYESADWKNFARGSLFDAMDTQLNPDGGHAESSPGYSGIVILSALEMYWLDFKKGDGAAWTQSRLDKLRDAAKAHVQLLSPDGRTAALSDTYRGPLGPFWNRPRVILNDTVDFPSARPRLRDAWLFGAKTADELWDSPVNPTLKNRGTTYSMPQSGYYVMRSGADTNARQITFDAGPTGGAHGHFDLLSFELFGYGKPLISDPGLYTYDDSDRRNWAVSTPAHNTISVDNNSHAAVEGVDNPDLWSSGISEIAGGYQVTARHLGYKGLAGLPVVSRSIWYDGDGVMLIADRGESTAEHNFATSFLLPGTNTSRDLGAGWIRSNNESGNVKIQTLLQPGQTAHRQNQINGGSLNVFTSDDPDGGLARDATRFYVDQTATFAQFITLVTTYSGKTAPNITAKIVSAESGAVNVQIYRNGNAAELIPFFNRPGADFRGSAPIAGGNDVAWDAAGRLHLVYNDRNEKNLKYSVRDGKGRWSIVQTIDAGFESGGWPSLALDLAGNPTVAYFDGDGGDLKFARLAGGNWIVEKVDTAGSTGLYPTLVTTRDGSPVIAYYNRTNGDLRLASRKKGGWQISTIDSDGDVGRGASMTLDPNFAKETRLAIAYDAAGGDKKFALQTSSGWDFQTIDNQTPDGGGSTSLVYEPFTNAGSFHPTLSYYDSSNSALKFARYNGKRWDTIFVVTQGVQGLYTSLYYDSGNKANILHFRKSNTSAYRAHGSIDGWDTKYIGTGGREIQSSKRADGTLAYTNLDADGLRIELLET